MTRGSIIFAQSSCEEDGLHLNSGLPEFSVPKSAASRMNPTYGVKPGNDAATDWIGPNHGYSVTDVDP